jgi:hypothetical protein
MDATIDYQAAEKVGFVIPNPRRLRVRDLLFARKPRKKRIPHPVQKPNGVRNDIFLSFFRWLLVAQPETIRHQNSEPLASNWRARYNKHLLSYG